MLKIILMAVVAVVMVAIAVWYVLKELNKHLPDLSKTTLFLNNHDNTRRYNAVCTTGEYQGVDNWAFYETSFGLDYNPNVTLITDQKVRTLLYEVIFNNNFEDIIVFDDCEVYTRLLND